MFVYYLLYLWSLLWVQVCSVTSFFRYDFGRFHGFQVDSFSIRGRYRYLFVYNVGGH